MTAINFKADAKHIVDALFDGKLFKDNLTRDDLNCIESYVLDMMESKMSSHIKCKEIEEKLNKMLEK